MADAIRTEKFENGTAFNRFESKSLAANLWTQENIQALNNPPTAATLAKLDLLSPGESVGVIARGADGFTLFDGQQLAAKEKHNESNESNRSFMPSVSAHNIISTAEKLGHDPHRWELRTSPQGPKCNLYLDAVMKAAGLPRPWQDTGAQSCEKLDAALAKDPRYDQVWHMDYSNEALSRKNWEYFQPQAGDILVWNRPDNGVIHVGVADGHGGTYYAGARDEKKHGFGHTKIEYFTGTVERPTNYGAPTAVYRYKNLKD